MIGLIYLFRMFEKKKITIKATKVLFEDLVVLGGFEVVASKKL